ncbi:MAG: haloacid dehalogenase-like hydrolase [Bacteroidota bacterium]
MLIGLDFDNTIVSYDALFYKVAIEQEMVPPTTAVNKVAVRNYLRGIDKEDQWTEMQGYVYGKRMQEAHPYPGAIEFMSLAKQLGHHLLIISHKTKYPFLGEKYDLHLSAKEWIKSHLWVDGKPLFSDSDYFFEVTKEDKINRITDCGCNTFIDDLPEILLNGSFPMNTDRILFDPEKHHSSIDLPELKIKSSWGQISKDLL